MRRNYCFWTREWIICSLHKEYADSSEPVFGCCNPSGSFILPPSCADHGVLAPWPTKMQSLPGGNSWFSICNFWLPYLFGSGQWNKDIGKLRSSKSASCFRKTLVFTILVEPISKKRPSVPPKVPRLVGKSQFPLFALALGFGFACEDLSRFGIPSSLTLSLAPRFWHQFYPLLIFLERDLAPAQEKHRF